MAEKRASSRRYVNKTRRPGESIQARPASAPRGRVTPKATSTTGGRYTAPIPKEYKVSPIWVPIAMGSLLAIGMLVIVLNYIGLLPAAPNNWYLLGGLGLITAGFIVATRWR
ncbi:MAG TPA: cell division protein CrgA [Acidimicrobiales bacterium]|nr:cell division protein CrgA [Acidimicrobiales bacterium]